MEIITKQIEMNRIGKYVTNQFLMDEDCNVPDNKHDMKKIILSTGKLKIDEIKPVENCLHISGKMGFQLLYETDSMTSLFSCIKGSLPFHEMIFLEEGSEKYSIKKCTVDVKAHMIHSRKFRMKATVEIGIQPEQRMVEEIPIDVNEKEKIYKKKEKKELLQVFVSKRDSLRIREELTLPGTKESIGTILWEDISCRKVEIKLAENEIGISGELSVFCFYESPDGKLEWVEQTLPYSGKIECYGVHENMFYHMNTNLESIHGEVRMDEDGEPRILGVEGVLQVEMVLYEEEPAEVLLDLYSIENHYELNTEEVLCEGLLLQNHSKCKIMERMTVPELKMDVLQICHSSGEIFVEKTETREDGVWITGILYVCFLYIKSSDETPIDMWQGMVPFSHLVECEMKDDNVKYEISTMLEQLNITLQGGNDIEVKAVVSFRGFFRKQEMLQKIKEVQVEKITETEKEKQPGLVGYVVREDEQLWDLAKKYQTTVDSIRNLNGLEEREIKKGERLLIFKENMSIL